MMKETTKRNLFKHFIMVAILLLASFSVTAFFVKANILNLPTDSYSPSTGTIINGNYDWEVGLNTLGSSSDYINYSVFRNDYCTAGATPTECDQAVSGKYIRFDTAEDLYRFSIDVSFDSIYTTGNPTEDVKLSDDKINHLLSYNYVLGKNIDYSIMQSKAFIPIGYAFTDHNTVTYTREFTGTFNGQGFEIRNLYLAGYDYLVYIDYIDAQTTIDIGMSSYYSMFNYNSGTIENLGLINPNLEILELNTDITKLANLVGENKVGGLVQNVYVIDNRTSATTAGMRYQVGTSSGNFQAAGVLHTNKGTFTNAYYSSLVVMNAYFVNKFTVQPVIYSNTGTIANLVYDSTVYLSQVVVSGQTYLVTTPNVLATGESTSLLKSDSSSLNSVSGLWYFYPDDGYPLLQGLTYNNGVYEISNAIDLAFLPRLLAFTTEANGKYYYASDYTLTNNIDMSILASDAYSIPATTFTGTLSGYNSQATDLSENYYIYNLNISKNIIRGAGYYAGLFSILGSGSEISNLNYSQSTVSFTNTETNYSYISYIGALAGKMTGGIISNVLIDVDIDLGNQALGMTYAGGVVGQASGIIEYTSNNGDIISNTHPYQSSYNIASRFYIGGIVGGTDTTMLTMDNVINNGVINGFQTSSVITPSSGYTDIRVYIGGIIGYINNLSGQINRITSAANKGEIYANNVMQNGTYLAYQFVGGVFGLLVGLPPVLEIDSTYLFADFYNSGTIHHTYTTDTATIYAAGIGASNTSAAVEYALMSNHGNFDFISGSATSGQTQFRFAPTIFDVGSVNVTLSRVYNYANLNYTKNIYTNISGLYRSLNSNNTLIRFSANYGDINYLNNSGTSQITLTSNINISGITTDANVNFLNVHNYGNINAVNLNLGTYTLNVAGLSQTLTSGNYIKNSLNDGDITFAKLTGSGNIYIGGLVNRNLSGDLQDPGQSTTQPKATIGIMNSINSGSFSSSYGLETANLYGISGTSNTFVGGIVVLNKGSIQDAGNLGDIKVVNTNASSAFNYQTNSEYAGLVTSYNSGIAAGGIAAAVIGGDSRIYDTANNGDVLVTANKYVRAGGLLGIALYEEAIAGGITSGMGLTNDIEDSILSNGLNFGNISALSNTIATYSTTPIGTVNSYWYSYLNIYDNTSSISTKIPEVTTTVGSGERPTIYSSAGGVIGYGLSVMQRMLNHGTISATDVAGGVVGATYVLGGSSQVTTVVHITTAINYGNIKAINNSDVSTINKYDMSYSEIASKYMADGNTFIYPSGFSVEYPEAKRGFGGIFGRLQRGLNGVMTNENGQFDFIVNTNPNIDLIGRLDQVYNFSSSSRYFRFYDAIYYSAKLNDTTQVVFTGFILGGVGTITGRNSSTDTVYADYYDYLYYQVGTRATRFYDSTNVYPGYYYYTSNVTIGGSARDGYCGQIPVPWITENPNDPNITDSATQYMYDPSFPMRTNPDLTEYVYYMNYDLLADRFKTGGTNPRPNGMYVLSTSAGSEYGLVLPSNIDLSKINLINEDYSGFVSLNMDYSAISPVIQETLPSEIITKYNNLKQTVFNNKAELIPNDDTHVILTENGGSSVILTEPVVNYISKTLTYTISMESFEPLQTQASFGVTQALTSSNALIAERAYDYYGHTPSISELQDYRALLVAENGMGISTNYPAQLSVNLPSYTITSNVTLSLGYFTVYSEAFVNDDLYASNNYFNDYHVYVTFTPNATQLAGSTGISSVAFDGGSNITASNPLDLRSLGSVSYLGSIKLNFEDSKGIWAQDYDFKDGFVIKYNDGTIVNSSNYTVTSTPVNIVNDVGYYTITFNFTTIIRSGDYYFEYSYFPTSTKYDTYFNKSASNQSSILGFDYYSNDGSTVINGTTITSYVNLGYPINMTTGTDNFTSSQTGGLLPYQSDMTYNINFMISGTLELSPFASVVSARLVSTTITNGYKTYNLEYITQAEDGSQTTFTHSMTERTVDLSSVLIDGNDTSINDVYATREAENTTFTVDLGFDQNLNLYNLTLGPNSYLEISVTGTTIDGLTNYTPAQIVGLTYSVNDYLIINMSYDTLPGIYTFLIRYYRDGSSTDYVTFATDLLITKREGINSYLSNIKFSEIMNEVTYPQIDIADSSGTIISSTYSPSIYFEGIDYDGADTAGYPYFRVDGRVSNVPLDSYVPYLFDYIPYGGTISRYAYNMNTSSWYWTPDVNANSDPSNIDQLAANYTVNQTTGQDLGDGEKVVVEYRVTSEDGMHFSYYFVSVTDVTFNVTILFDVYYCSDATQESCVLASDSSEFNNQTLVITVQNLQTDGDDSVYGISDPNNYPTFSTIYGLNNRTTQFYFINSSDYYYRFSRNMAGFYTFDVQLPLDQYLNNLYAYDIQIGDYYLNDASTYNNIDNLQGKYYYIGYSTSLRTRRFNVYIRSISNPETKKPWGLFDFFKSWGN